MDNKREFMIETLPEAMKATIRVSGAGCWEWTGRIDKDGYGRWGRGLLAHRVVYMKLAGPIPGGLTIDHLCRNRRCVNPAHLEPVTQGENTRRGFSPSVVHARENRCSKGHPYDEENTRLRTRDGEVTRECRKCNNLASAEYRERNRDLVRARDRARRRRGTSGTEAA